MSRGTRVALNLQAFSNPDVFLLEIRSLALLLRRSTRVRTFVYVSTTVDYAGTQNRC